MADTPDGEIVQSPAEAGEDSLEGILHFRIQGAMGGGKPDNLPAHPRDPDAKLRVVVVGEDADDRFDTARLVTLAGFEVVGRPSFGTEARVVGDETRPDVVLVAIEEPPARALATIASLIERLPQTPVLAFSSSMQPGLMRAAMRAGVYDFLRRPLSKETLAEAINSSVGALGHEDQRDDPAGVLVTSLGVRGGAGTSVVTARMARLLATAADERVALVELDSSGGSLAWMFDQEVEFGKGLAALAASSNARIDREVVAGYLQQVTDNLDVLYAGEPRASALAAGLDPDNHSLAGPSPETAQAILQALRQTHEFVLVDAHSAPAETLDGVLAASHVILLVASRDVLSARRLLQTLDNLHGIGISDYRMRLVVTDVVDKPSMKEEDFERIAGLKISARIPHSADLGHLLDVGELLGPAPGVDGGLAPLADSLAGTATGDGKEDGGLRGILRSVSRLAKAS